MTNIKLKSLIIIIQISLGFNSVHSQNIWAGSSNISNDSLISRFSEAMTYKILSKKFFELAINKEKIYDLITQNEQINVDSVSSIIFYDISSLEMKDLSNHVTDRLELTFIKYKYNVLERSNLNQILLEQSLSQTGIVQEKSVIESGRLYGADGIFFVNCTMFSDVIRYNFKLVDTRTSQMIYKSTFIESDETRSLETNWLGFYINWFPQIVTVKCIFQERGLIW